MQRMRRLLTLAVSAALLAACSGDPAGTRDNSGEEMAEGEVLGGSISDAMIPLETVRSQSPALRAAPVSTDDAETEEDGDSADLVGEDGASQSSTESQTAQASEVEG